MNSGTTFKWRESIIARLTTFALVVVGVLSVCYSQQTVVGRGKNFSISPDFYDPPHEAQMKSLLKGAEARPASGGRILVKGGQLQTFKEDGTKELFVQAPSCVYETSSRSVHSEDQVSAETADGKFKLSGTGFTWEQVASTLYISNRVRTYIHPDLLKKEPSGDQGATGGLTITSDSFHYAETSGTGVYLGNVKVAGTNLALDSNSLIIRMPAVTRQLESIRAQGAVGVDYGEVHAAGDDALYTAATGLVTVTGNPQWRMEGREGRANHVVIDPTNRVLTATGGSWIRLAGKTLSTAALLGASGEGKSDREPGFVEIRSEDCEVRTNQAVFKRSVNVKEVRTGEPEGTMTCEQMLVTFSGTNQLDTLVAEQKVKIVSGERRLGGAKAVYSSTNTLLQVSGDPYWEFGPRTGRGKLIQLNTTTREMLVRGNASMQVPAGEFSQLAAMGNEKPAAQTAEAKTRTAEIYSEEYVFSNERAQFRGGVYISHPKMNWACEDLVVFLPQDGGTVNRIVSDKSVVFDLIDDKGQKIHGTSDRAEYTYAVKAGVTNDFVELSGNPTLQRKDPSTGNPVIIRNRVLILDRTRNQIIAPGQFNVKGWGEVNKTNVLGSDPIRGLNRK